MDTSTAIHIPTLLATSMGISPHLAQTLCAEATLSLDDKPLPITSQTDRFWLKIEEDDWGKKLTVKGTTNTYVVQLKKDWDEVDYDDRRLT